MVMKSFPTSVFTLLLSMAMPLFAAPATGPLRVLRSNPRYFSDGSGKAVYLTGSHTWCNFATDQGKNDPPAGFDFNAYLDFLAAHNHNFFRGWVWDLAWSNEGGNPNGLFRWSPHPWLRTGPGKATDGKPKFDLDQFNQAFFDRIRSRTIAARDRGIYVSIMLFQGYGVQFNRNAKDGFPLDGRNNINGVDAGTGHAANTLEKAAVTARQDAYVKKVIDAVNDLDNVLYEISNESGVYATAWQYHMIDLIHKYEASKAKQHPGGHDFPILPAGPTPSCSPARRTGYRPELATATRAIPPQPTDARCSSTTRTTRSSGPDSRSPGPQASRHGSGRILCVATMFCSWIPIWRNGLLEITRWAPTCRTKLSAQARTLIGRPCVMPWAAPRCTRTRPIWRT